MNTESRVTEIRQAMLDCLSDLEDSYHQTQVWAHIHYARDIQTLWYLRPDVMTLLANVRGESVAQQKLLHITALFSGLLPAAQKPRPSRLRG